MIPKKSRSWALRSARPCLRKRTSSESSAQNSLQKNWPFGARQGCNSPFKVGSRLRQNAQYAATSASPVYAFIGSPHVSSPSANHHNKYRLENYCTDDYTSVENAKVRRQTKVRRFFK